MNIYLVVKRLAEKKGKSIYRLEKDLSMSNGSIARWKHSMPRADNLQSVANYLNVTAAYILDSAKETQKC